MTIRHGVGCECSTCKISPILLEEVIYFKDKVFSAREIIYRNHMWFVTYEIIENDQIHTYKYAEMDVFEWNKMVLKNRHEQKSALIYGYRVTAHNNDYLKNAPNAPVDYFKVATDIISAYGVLSKTDFDVELRYNDTDMNVPQYIYLVFWQDALDNIEAMKTLAGEVLLAINTGTDRFIIDQIWSESGGILENRTIVTLKREGNEADE